MGLGTLSSDDELGAVVASRQATLKELLRQRGQQNAAQEHPLLLPILIIVIAFVFVGLVVMRDFFHPAPPDIQPIKSKPLESPTFP